MIINNKKKCKINNVNVIGSKKNPINFKTRPKEKKLKEMERIEKSFIYHQASKSTIYEIYKSGLQGRKCKFFFSSLFTLFFSLSA
jgi:hypothetical protein